MKYVVAALVFMFACNSADKEEQESPVITEQQVQLAPEEIYAWRVETDSQKLVKNPALPVSYLNEDSMIRGLNSQFPEIQLEKVRKGDDTLFTRIQNAEHLTQRMGSAGPELYFATAYFNLTAVPGIRYVYFDLTEGDHAGPGLYGPKSFSDYKIDSATLNR